CQRMRLPRGGSEADFDVERLTVAETQVGVGKARIGEARVQTEHLRTRLPLLRGLSGDRDPAIVAATSVDAMWRDRGISVAQSLPLPPVSEHVHVRRAEV